MTAAASGVLRREAVRLDESAVDRFDAVRRCGAVLVETGAVTAPYVDAMLAREQSISTYVGAGVALPHGIAEGRSAVLRDTIAVLRFPAGVDWGEARVTICVAIAARGDDHLRILGRLARVLLLPGQARRLREMTDPDSVVRLLTGGKGPLY